LNILILLFHPLPFIDIPLSSVGPVAKQHSNAAMQMRIVHICWTEKQKVEKSAKLNHI